MTPSKNDTKCIPCILYRILKYSHKIKQCILYFYIGSEDYITPGDLCASSFFKAVMNRKSKVAALKNIYLVLDDEDIEKIYLCHFEYYFKTTPRGKSKVVNSKSNQSFSKILNSLSKNEGIYRSYLKEVGYI